VVVHTCNPNTLEATVGESRVKASLGYRVRLFLKKKKRNITNYSEISKKQMTKTNLRRKISE
jgi:hypothetical protein